MPAWRLACPFATYPRCIQPFVAIVAAYAEPIAGDLEHFHRVAPSRCETCGLDTRASACMGAIDARHLVARSFRWSLVGESGNPVTTDREADSALYGVFERRDRQSLHLRRRRRRSIEGTHGEDDVAIEARSGRRYASEKRRGAGLRELCELDAREARGRSRRPRSSCSAARPR
jgi:hypothetical protein